MRNGNSDGSAAGALFESNPAWKKDFEDQEGYHPDDVDDNGGITEMGIAQGTLDMLACEIPKKYMFEPVVDQCMAWLRSADPNQRKAGIACLGVIAEGCANRCGRTWPRSCPTSSRPRGMPTPG